MPISLTTYTDLEIPTPNGDPTTYGVIINQFFESLTTKIAALATRISAAEASLGDTSTANTILYNITQVTNINSLLQADGVTSDKLLTGTSTTLLPDPYSGNYSTTSTFPAFTGTGEALENIDPPETESEILNFDYVAFRNALDGILSIISTRVAQTEADILQARIDVCKAKAYIDAYNAGGTTVKVLGNVATYFWVNPDNGASSGSYLQKAIYTISQTSAGFAGYSYTNGLLTATYALVSDPVYPYGTSASTNLQAHNRFTSNGYLTSGSFVNIYANFVDLSGFSVGTTINLIGHYSPLQNPFFTNGSVGTVGMQIQNATMQIKWLSNGLILSAQYVPTGSSTQSQVNGVSASSLAPTIIGGTVEIGMSQHTIAEQTIYGTPDVSYCDTNPGGPHFTSGSYT
jgi:hypothetical protein